MNLSTALVSARPAVGIIGDLVTRIISLPGTNINTKPKKFTKADQD